MPKKLPNGWVKTTLGDVCLPATNLLPGDSPDTEFTYFDIGGIDGRRNRIAETKTVTGRTAPSRARQAVRQDDILFSTVRTYLRNIARVERDYPNAVASTGFAVLRPAKGVSSEYLFYQLLSDDFLQPLHSLQTGTSYPAVRSSDVLAQPVLLPPVREQERIVAKLNASLGSVERAEVAALRALDRLRRYRESVLHAAVTGSLTRAPRVDSRNGAKKGSETGSVALQRLLVDRRARWEAAEFKRLRSAGKAPKDSKWKSRYRDPKPPDTDGLPRQPDDWTWASVDQLGWTSGYGSSVKCTYDARGPAVLRIPNIRNRSLDLKDLKFATSSKAIGSDDFIAPGDLLVIRTNGSKDLIGRAAVVRTSPKQNVSFASYLIRFRLVGDETLWSWVSLAWDSDLCRTAIDSRAKTTAGQYNVSLSGLSALSLPLPPPGEQAEIVEEVERRLSAADRLAATLDQQVARARKTRELLLRDAFSGKLVPQDTGDEPASALLPRIRAERRQIESEQREARRQGLGERKAHMKNVAKEPFLTPQRLTAAFERIGRKADARRLFAEAGCSVEHVTGFYETLRATPEVRAAFETAGDGGRREELPVPHIARAEAAPRGRFRLAELWLEDFKNLKDYTVRFDPSHGLDVVLGWNGTGKSNLFESLVIIFRDLHEWSVRNKWPDEPMTGYRLSYELDDELVEIVWNPAETKRPVVTSAIRSGKGDGFGAPVAVTRTAVPLPRFVFGYYSGPTNRLAEHFLPMKQAHYVRLREAKADDAKTLAALLEQRRFFCAETHHAKYVLLAFSYKEDSEISAFLKDRLRILGFESALFIIRRPRWAKPGSKAQDFWGATGIMRRVMERLRRYAIAPMVVEQTVSDGYRTTTEDHYYFFLRDLESLHSFAAEYEDARTFFLALESTDFSELIHDVKIQVSIKATDTEKVGITFHQLSEGEQQLLMVLGLMRFTKSHQSLVLLDEPDTHLNPHWSVNYLKDLTQVMSDGALEAPEQQTSQILMATHDPLVIASLVKEQIHLLTRDSLTGACKWVPASINPRGLGFTGILTSEMFGFRSDLDEETLADLDNRVRLVAKDEALTSHEKTALEEVDKRLADAGFSKAFSDPYYAAFVRAWGRRHSELMAGQQFVSPEKRQEIDRVASEVLKEAVAEVEQETRG